MRNLMVVLYYIIRIELWKTHIRILPIVVILYFINISMLLLLKLTFFSEGKNKKTNTFALQRIASDTFGGHYFFTRVLSTYVLFSFI